MITARRHEADTDLALDRWVVVIRWLLLANKYDLISRQNG